MLNYIWLGLMVAAVIIGGWNGHLDLVTNGALQAANKAVLEIAFTLIGVMALWLGVMRLAERAGLVALMARILRPVMTRIFPDVPANHPAMGSMLTNIAANMLGLNNAATPFGLRAMKDLESLNTRPGTATNAMCTFLAINTSGIQLIPVTAIAILTGAGSTNPTCIVGTSIICTACGATAGVLMAKFLSKLPMFRLPPAAIIATDNKNLAAASASAAISSSDSKAVIKEAAGLQPLKWWGMVIITIFLLFFFFLFLRLVWPEKFGMPVPADVVPQNLFVRMVGAVSLLAIPFLLSAVPLYATVRRVKVYEEFVDGAKEGFDVAIRIIPFLVAMLVAVAMFRAAGGIDWLTQLLQPALNRVGFPPELLPMVLVRPLSGSATLGFFTELVKHFGPDNIISRMAGTIYGSTETTFYVLAVYFGSVAVKRTRHAVLAGLTADLVGVVAAVTLCRIIFK